ncbi:MAG: hypothetical protein ABW328_00290 [Ilumatobacteraceae bacterium]
MPTGRSICLAAAIGLGIRDGMKESRRILRGQRLRTAGVLLMCAVLAGASGAIGVLILLFTDLGFTVAGAATTVAGVVLVPSVALVLVNFHDQAAADDPPHP